MPNIKYLDSSVQINVKVEPSFIENDLCGKLCVLAFGRCPD